MTAAHLNPSTESRSQATRTDATRSGIDLRQILVPLLIGFGVQNLVLWRFLDFAPSWLYLGGAVLLCGIALVVHRDARLEAAPRVAPLALLGSAAVALLLCMLGGEGNLFYANADWQVRNAVLGDLIANPWPFAYTARGEPEMLRAPLGLYLIPALAGKVWGFGAAHFVLLAQNTLFLTSIFALGSTLFATARARLLALAVFVFFSGMDIIGHLLAKLLSPDYEMLHHIEGWSTTQFSSHMTQIFWVPHHGLAGWLGAALFLLWRVGRVPIGAFFAFVPLLLIWSPLIVMGLLPFALYAGLLALRRREIGAADVLLPLATVAFVVPLILYLGAGNESVDKHLFPFGIINYILFMALEAVVLLVGVFIITPRPRFGLATLALVAGCLFLFPFYQIGETIDFTMRATIPALAILAVMVADALPSAFTGGRPMIVRLAGLGVAAALAIGSLTGILEIWRAFAYSPVPMSRCTMIGAWDQQTVDLPPAAKVVYIAPVASLPPAIRPAAPTLLPDSDPPRCWQRPWKTLR